VSGPVTRTRQGAIAALAVTAAAGLSLSGIPQSSATSAPTTSAGNILNAAAATANGGQSNRLGAYDARSGSLRTQLGEASSVVAHRGKAFKALVRSVGPQGIVDIDPATGTPRNIGRLDGFLTGPSAANASTVALGYVRAHLPAMGLTKADLKTLTLRDAWVDAAGIHHLSWTQSANGIPVFGNGLKANVAKRGQLISIQGSPVSGLTRLAAKTSATPRLSASSARNLAARAVGGSAAKSSAVTSKSGDLVKWANFDQAQLVWFVTDHGAHLGWSTYVQAGGNNLNYQQVVDAHSGAVLYRHDTVNEDRGDGRVLGNHPGAPVEGKQKTVNFYKAGFLPPHAKLLTHGNYVAAWSDVNDNNRVDPNETVAVPGLKSPHHRAQYKLTHFNHALSICKTLVCTWNPNKPFSWRTNRRADVTQGFYFDSIYHNYLKKAPFGFTAKAGNFERVGGDPVLLNDLDGANTDHGFPDPAHVDNANMDTPPDGIPPTMQMYLFHFPQTKSGQDPFIPKSVATSSTMDPTVIMHEYTHGLSNRLVVDATGNSTLNSIQAGAMGEAWSDYYALDYSVSHGLIKDSPKAGDVVEGRYADDGLLRTEAIDCPVGSMARLCRRPIVPGHGGYTYGDFPIIGGSPEVHASGEVWAQTLWDLRNALGHRVAGMIITRAMSLSPNDPSMLDMRNSILQADLAAYGGAHLPTIWKVFAHRGMGFFAATLGSDDTTPVQNFRLPPGPAAPRGTVSGQVVDRLTGQPVKNALVVIAGHGSGFTGDYAARTDAGGRYSINHVFVGKYPEIVAFGPGYEVITKSVRVRPQGSTVNFKPRRDWAAASGGGFVKSFTGPDFSSFNCGPNHAIDLSQGTGWASTTGDNAGTPTNTVVPKNIVVQLPKTITVSSFGVNPTATCGDPGSASTAGYRIETSPDGTTWTTAAQGTFTTANQNQLNTVPANAPTANVKYVRFTMLSPQVPNFSTTCPNGPYAGCQFMDMTELEVYGTH
jgi:extracellular elastinolytic metalloproteinase